MMSLIADIFHAHHTEHGFYFVNEQALIMKVHVSIYKDEPCRRHFSCSSKLSRDFILLMSNVNILL